MMTRAWRTHPVLAPYAVAVVLVSLAAGALQGVLA